MLKNKYRPFVQKSLIPAILTMFVAQVFGQMLSPSATVKNYSIAQRRLLVLNTAQFINLITQYNLDKDSVMMMACHITGQPFLLPYDEGFNVELSSGDAAMINSGHIRKAEQILKHRLGEKRIQLLIGLAIWYLHRPGIYQQDLNQAQKYVDEAIRLCNDRKYDSWQIECQLLLSELYMQQGKTKQSREMLNHFISEKSQRGNIIQKIRALQELATIFPYRDSTKLTYIRKAIVVSKDLGYKEKEIELLFTVAHYYANADPSKMYSYEVKILSLMHAINYQHTLFAQNELAYATMGKMKFIEALKTARLALANMQWSGLNAVSGAFLIRMGAVYQTLGKDEEAMWWFRQAIRNGSAETHFFWYKSVFFATTMLYMDKKYPECLALLDSVTSKFPPVTPWEKAQILSTQSICYNNLNDQKRAHEVNLSLFALIVKNPSMDHFGELTAIYYDIVDFYLSRGNLEKAKLFLSKASDRKQVSDDMKATKHALLYRIDSIEGRYKSALQHHVLFKKYYDAFTGLDQRKQINELTVKYAAAKKDQDIIVLRQQKAAQQAELNQNKKTKNLMMISTILLLVIIALLLNHFRLKQRTNEAIRTKNNTLQHLLHEKEWLLKEVHHRVKNNLHTVICLLESQAVYLENDALKAIENSQHRIYAMSLIHQKLYQSEDVKTIDMASYLPEFIEYLNDSFDTHHSIRFHLEIAHVQLGVSQAIPLALIINEAVTNAIKYAFPDHIMGVIRISMTKDGKQIILIIADNGIGMEPKIAGLPLESLGLKLMHGLSEDIHGRITFENNRGTKITIVFQEDPLNDNHHFIKTSMEKDGFV